MALNNILKRLNLLQILREHQPILLNHLITQVINKILDEVDHPLVEQVSGGEIRQVGLLGCLQGQPHVVQLALGEFAPE